MQPEFQVKWVDGVERHFGTGVGTPCLADRIPVEVPGKMPGKTLGFCWIFLGKFKKQDIVS